MPDDPAKNYIERLPEIIDREEGDTSHLDQEMLEILYPDRADASFNVSVVFGPPPSSEDAAQEEAMKGSYDRAVGIAQKSGRYNCEGSGRFVRHQATYGIDEVNALHDVFHLVSEFPSCEILVRGKRVPYGRELWLPLLWFFRKDPLEM